MKTEADKLRNSIQYGLGVMDAGSGEFKELSNKIDELFELSYLEGQSNPKIKQLEWDDYDGVYFDSISAVGHYIVFDGDKFSEASYRFALSYNGNLVDYFESIDEAKSAAQRDFERRVMECLD